MDCLRRCDADRLLVPHYLETLARDMATLLADRTQHELLCAIQHSPVWSGAACGDGRGLVTRWSANDRFVRQMYACHMELATVRCKDKVIVFRILVVPSGTPRMFYHLRAIGW